jgi:ABC-type uncharacterized transport system ATPase subunit
VAETLWQGANMQQFIVEVLVTVNTLDTVSETEVQKHMESYLEEYDIGNAEVQDCKEI